MLGFNIEDAQVLQYQLDAFIAVIESEWANVITQWDTLKECWQDHQYNDFEPFFESLSATYQKTLEEIYEYKSFLQQKINAVEKAPNLEHSEITKPILNRWGAGEFTTSKVSQLPDDLKGIYYIHAPDIETSEDPDITYYVGKSDDSIKGRLLSHLRKSSNKKLREAINSGQPLLFYWHESPSPSYEEALEIKRLKSAGMLKGQRRERKILIDELD